MQDTSFIYSKKKTQKKMPGKKNADNTLKHLLFFILIWIFLQEKKKKKSVDLNRVGRGSLIFSAVICSIANQTLKAKIMMDF